MGNPGVNHCVEEEFERSGENRERWGSQGQKAGTFFFFWSAMDLSCGPRVLCCCEQPFSSFDNGGYFLVVMHRRLIANGFSCCGAQARGHIDFSSWSSWV